VTEIVTRPPILAAVTLLVIVYDALGRPLGELQTHGLPERITWRVDGHATVPLILAPSILTDKPDLLTPGNRAVVYLSNGLPPWAGVIDLPIEETTTSVNVTLYSAEFLFDWALTPSYALYEASSARTPRDILTDLMERALVRERYGIVPPASYAQGVELVEEPVEAEFSYASFGDALAALQNMDARLHWFLEPVDEDSALLFRVVLYRDALRAAGHVARLAPGRNFSDMALLNQGPLINEVFMAAAGTDFSDPDNIATVAFDGTASGRYGRRQTFRSVPEGETGGQSLFQLAEAELKRRSSPRRRFRGRMLDLTPGRFADVGLGRRVIVETANGDLAAAIIGMEWETATNTLALVVEHYEELV
jgi:hypothetical protein